MNEKELVIILLTLIAIPSLWIGMDRFITIDKDKIDYMFMHYKICREATNPLNCAYYVARGERFEKYTIIACGVESWTIVGVKSDKRDLIISEHPNR
jgi:hypothetical protein